MSSTFGRFDRAKAPSVLSLFVKELCDNRAASKPGMVLFSTGLKVGTAIPSVEPGIRCIFAKHERRGYAVRFACASSRDDNGSVRADKLCKALGRVKVNFLLGHRVIFSVNSRLIRKFQNRIIMSERWYVYLIIAVIAYLLSLVCEKFNIIKSKPLRFFTVLFVAYFLCWIIYDLIV